MGDGYKVIVHPTDFSDVSADAFAHALKLALASKADLYLLHASTGNFDHVWHRFPPVRYLLGLWGLIDPGTKVADLEPALGIKVMKVRLERGNVARQISRFATDHNADLVVMGTHGREGLPRWISGSVAEDIARQTKVPSLFVTQGAKGFVEAGTGRLRLDRVLVPVDHHPRPAQALNALGELFDVFMLDDVLIDVVHVGEKAPHIIQRSSDTYVQVELVKGPVVPAIVNLAEKREMKLIVMPTAGHHGVMDALRGSTTEQVLREASCPVLALPA